MKFYQDFKLGILGGGQLGRMLIQSGIDFNLNPYFLDPDRNAPCNFSGSHFTEGSLCDYGSVYNFGADKDLITIEIENVNVEALKALQKKGIKVFPQPEVIEIIQDKRSQKSFFRKNNIPTSDFVLLENKADILNHADFLPAFQKLGRAGYDGRGVQRITDIKSIGAAFDEASLLEKLVDFEKELSVIVARNEKDEVAVYPVVEMVFHPEHNMVEYLFSPAQVNAKIEKEAKEIAEKVIRSFNMVGILAVEMFLTKEGKILVNEVAPRPHNSGHHTIKGNYTSQYEQHLRSILDLPLGSTQANGKSALVNLLGEENYSGLAIYQGIDEVLKIEGVYVHLYGKKFTRPFRKMGHVTILDNNMEELKAKAEFVKKTLKIIA
ncbi:MAG TPA: 5-(carboxyamino)imidazole ribonucleotide synthase [Cytophagaceae bacterium]|jgi:5-(carboxyamino)imidazole ribonucleotide synthase|nr:5-(carboxyamino)imidazole ribonucleotide synthase [Cytophagaceae bacterium]